MSDKNSMLVVYKKRVQFFLYNIIQFNAKCNYFQIPSSSHNNCLCLLNVTL